MKHQTVGGLEPSGNVLVQTNCLDIKMALKTSCKDVATRVGVGRFALHIFCLGFGAPCPRKGCPCFYPYKLESLRYISGAGIVAHSIFIQILVMGFKMQVRNLE